jgi:hypothetical protein
MNKSAAIDACPATGGRVFLASYANFEPVWSGGEFPKASRY